jgi:hypothetical protein
VNAALGREQAKQYCYNIKPVKICHGLKQKNSNQMKKDTEIKIFEDRKVRSVWDSENEKWYISIIDVIAVLTESSDPNAYWRKLKQRLKEEGNETVTNCHGLKMPAPDGKMRLTDVADAIKKNSKRTTYEMDIQH